MAKIFLFRKGSEMAITTIERVAEAFLSIEPMSPKKLQKLCYYAYSWFTVVSDDGQRLFNNRFEAWVHGPVDPPLYHDFKMFGWDDIPLFTGRLSIDESVLGFIHDVHAAYGELTGDELEFLTHSEDPWKIARGGLAPHVPCNKLIRDEDIVAYYGREMERE